MSPSTLFLFLTRHKYTSFYLTQSSVSKIIKKKHHDLGFKIQFNSSRFPLLFLFHLSNMNNRKSPCKQQRMKNSHSIPVPNSNRMRSTSSMGSSYTKNPNSYNRNYSQTTSPTAMSACSLPAVPLFYSNTYADPPECSSLPKPPESWYLQPNDESLPVQIEEKEKPKARSNNRGFYSSFYSKRTHDKFPTPYISVKA